jgi:hypothetical protein
MAAILSEANRAKTNPRKITSRFRALLPVAGADLAVRPATADIVVARTHPGWL